MSSYYAENYSESTPWNETGVGTNAGVTVTHPAAAGKQHWVGWIDCSGDAAAVVTIESPSGAVLWRKRFAAAFQMEKNFAASPLQGADSQAVLVKVSASTANCEANIGGFTGPNV